MEGERVTGGKKDSKNRFGHSIRLRADRVQIEREDREGRYRQSTKTGGKESRYGPKVQFRQYLLSGRAVTADLAGSCA